MAYQAFCELIDRFPELTELRLQGLGEPMLHPGFFDMVAYAAGRGVRVATNTNQTVCTERRVRECLESGLDTMYISLDGVTAAVYEAIRMDAKFDRIMANLARLMRMRAQVSAGAPRPHVGIVGVAMRNFVDEQTLLHEDPVRVSDVFDEIRDLARALGMTVRIPPPSRHVAVAALDGNAGMAVGMAGKRHHDYLWGNPSSCLTRSKPNHRSPCSAA